MQNDEKISVSDVEKIAQRNENELNRNFSEVYGDYFVHEAIMEFGEFEQELEARRDKPFYIPGKTTLLKYVDDLYFEENRAYQALKKYVQQHFFPGNAKKTKELCEDVHDECEMGASVSDIFTPFERAGIVFEGEKQVSEVMDLVVDLSNNTRLWENNGFTPNELRKQEQPALNPLPGKGPARAMTNDVNGQVHTSDGNIKSKKVGRNELCPCGSGKKYKHCCGR